MLNFCSIGSVHTEAVFPAPERGESEPEEAFAERQRFAELRKDVLASVRLMSPAVRIEWAQSLQRVLGVEQARVKASLDAGEQPPSAGLTPEGQEAIAAEQRRVAAEGLAGVSGVAIDGKRVDGLTGMELALALESASLLGPFAWAVRRGQTPAPSQLER